MIIINKENKILWDIESTKLNDIAYKLYLNHNEKFNNELYNRGKDYRSSYMTYGDFLNNWYSDYSKQAKIILRRDKIENIKQKIYD
jgi:hypothetical protein